MADRRSSRPPQRDPRTRTTEYRRPETARRSGSTPSERSVDLEQYRERRERAMMAQEARHRQEQRRRAEASGAQGDPRRTQRPVPSRTQSGHRTGFTLALPIVAILLFLVASNMLRSCGKQPQAAYMVTTGSLSENKVYTAMAIREEHVIASEYTGHVNYYNREGDRISTGALSYTVDGTGRIAEYLEAERMGEDNAILTENDYLELRQDSAEFASGFSPRSFNEVYDFLGSFGSTLQKMSASSILADIDKLSATDLAGSIHRGYSAESGIIVFRNDGYEGYRFDTVTPADFAAETLAGYDPGIMENNAMVDVGEPIYRLCTDENWSIVLPAEREDAERLEEMEYVKVRFLKNKVELWGRVTRREDSEGNCFVQLSFTNSMVTFCTDRFLRVELLIDDQQGLKVPSSALVDNEFFIVPKEYLTTGYAGDRGVLRRTYTEDGTETVEFIAASPYKATETDYYLDQSVLKRGDILHKPDSAAETFTLAQMDKLTGVYLINRGIAEFREVNILNQNDDYLIVEKNSQYGLAEYDRIVLDADTAHAGELYFDND